MPASTHLSTDLDREIVRLWREGIRQLGELGRRLGVDARRVRRHIARMVGAGAWPFPEAPGPGRAPVASGFVALPIRHPRGPAREPHSR